MYTMKEVCNKIGMTYETLRYYCNQKLVPNVKRNENNYRIFDEKDIAWLEGLQCLRKAGMSLNDMKIYMAHCIIGKASIPERQIMLEKTKNDLLEKMHELTETLDYLDAKQKFYNDILDGKIEYTSNLITVEKN